jgi:hypothetical protein
MVFARNALAPGPGNACNSIHLSPTCRKVKVGRASHILDKPALPIYLLNIFRLLASWNIFLSVTPSRKKGEKDE